MSLLEHCSIRQGKERLKRKVLKRDRKTGNDGSNVNVTCYVPRHTGPETSCSDRKSPVAGSVQPNASDSHRRGRTHTLSSVDVGYSVEFFEEVWRPAKTCVHDGGHLEVSSLWKYWNRQPASRWNRGVMWWDRRRWRKGQKQIKLASSTKCPWPSAQI